MRYFYDCEFLENGRTVDLISIGIVADDGRELYLVNSDAPWSRISEHDWLMTNVVPALPVIDPGTDEVGIQVDYDHPAVQPAVVIADRVHDFLLADQLGPGRDQRSLWAWYGAYDHVALCQLWGRMIDLPDGVPMFTGDLKQEHVRLGRPALPLQEGPVHNALADARHNRDVAHTLDALVAVAAEGISTPALRRDVSDWLHERLDSHLISQYVTSLAAELIVMLDLAAQRGVTAEQVTSGA